MLLYLRISIFSLLVLFILSNCKEAPSNNPEGKATYSKPHRPQFHFSPPANWMNDPNGMVFFEGEYHLFYQYYPDSTVWGPMHWGHAVSTDLVHWEHLPIALYPDSLGLIFSGSAVVDWNNTSGFGDADSNQEKPPLVAIFTQHLMEGERAGRTDYQCQSIAYSNDRGRTWTKYEGNPVIPSTGIRDFRDPKVFWHEASGKWVMLLASWDHIKLYGSPDLKHWTQLSDFGLEWGGHGGVWECPDLFPLKVEGTDETKWVMLVSVNPGAPNGGSGTQYFIGDFDGKTFTLDPEFAKSIVNLKTRQPGEVIFEDFEKVNFGKWKVEGTAFGKKPANWAFPGQGELRGFIGKGLANSFLNGDTSTGKLVSPVFTILQDFINFQMSGGSDPTNTCMNLIVDGKIVRTATGTNYESLHWMGWDVTALKGKKAHLEIVDASTSSPWGHINVDEISFAPQMALSEYERGVWLDFGKDNYAGITWSDIPANDGRRLFLGWMGNWHYAQLVPTSTWRSAMTLPRQLLLQHTQKGLRLSSVPVKELVALRQASFELPAQALYGSLDLTKKLGFPPSQMEVILEIELPAGANTNFGIVLSNSKGEEYRTGYDSATRQLFSDRMKSGKVNFSPHFAGDVQFAPRLEDGNIVKMHLFFDTASCELFADEGATAMTNIFFPNGDFKSLALYADGAPVQVKKATFYQLNSANLGVTGF